MNEYCVGINLDIDGSITEYFKFVKARDPDDASAQIHESMDSVFEEYSQKIGKTIKPKFKIFQIRKVDDR